MAGYQFTDNQSVDPRISEASDKELCEYVDNCIQEAEKHRNKFAIMSGNYLDDANKCSDLYNGHLYDKREKVPYECKPDDYAYYVDFDAQLMRQFVHKEYVKQVDEGTEMANKKDAIDSLSFTRLIAYCHKRNQSDEKEDDMLRYRGICGNGFYKFQPVVEDGVNWPGHDTIDPRFVFISPGAKDTRDAVYVGYRRPVPTSEIKESYQDKSERIKADVEISTDSNSSVASPRIQMGLGASIVNSVGKMVDALTGKKIGQQTWLTEFYYMDPQKAELRSEEDIKAWVDRNPGFGKGPFAERIISQHMEQLAGLSAMFPEQPESWVVVVREYPHGRCIVKCNDVVLDDVHNPYPIIPIINCKCYRRPNEVWAKGIIHKIREPIQNKQLILSGVAGNLDYRLKSVYFITGGGRRDKNLKKVPTEANTIIDLGESPNADIKALPVPQLLPQDVLAASEHRRKEAEMTGGLDSVLGGVNQTGTYSGTQYEKQLEQAMGKVAPRYRELNRARKAIGELYLWFIQNYVTDERKLDFLTDTEERVFLQVNAQEYIDGNMTMKNDVTRSKYHFFIDVAIDRPISQAEQFRQIQEFAKIVAPISPMFAIKIQLDNLKVTGKYELMAQFEEEAKKFADKQDAANQHQAALAQFKQQNDAAIKERDMDVKEVKAGSQVQQAQADIVLSLAKAGVQIPQQFLDELGITNFRMTESVVGDEVGK